MSCLVCPNKMRARVEGDTQIKAKARVGCDALVGLSHELHLALCCQAGTSYFKRLNVLGQHELAMTRIDYFAGVEKRALNVTYARVGRDTLVANKRELCSLRTVILARVIAEACWVARTSC